MQIAQWAKSLREKIFAGQSKHALAHGSEAGENLRESYCIEVKPTAFDELNLRVSGRISMENAEKARRELIAMIEAEPLRNVVLDLGEVTYFDSSGAAIIMEARRKCRELNNSFKLVNVAQTVQGFLRVVHIEEDISAGILKPRTRPNLFVQIGEGTIGLYNSAGDIITFIGALATALARDLSRPGKLRWDGLWRLIEKSGGDAVPIVTLLSFLMGSILAFQSADQLRKFGATLYVADLVSISICLEMGPLLTALIIAGWSGAAFAAHIGTMQVTEEIDALRVMAIDPIRYLVSPRIIALAVVAPCLTIFADVVGVLGGFMVGVFSLDVTPSQYLSEVKKVLELDDVLKGITKSFVFGVEVAMVGCMKGFQVKGGAESVGAATTSAVVTSIFVIVVTDAVFAVVFHYFRII